MPTVLSCESLEKRYGATVALGGVDLEVERGELLGLLGPNGAGKSTLTKIACGLVRATGGRAEVEGAPAGSAPARAAIGYLAELFRFPDWLTADELIALHQELAGSEGGAAERGELLELVGLADARDGEGGRHVEGHAAAARHRAGARGLAAAADARRAHQRARPVGRRVVRDLLRELRSRGVAVVLSSHLLSEVELVCDRVAILVGGQVVARGTPAELARPRGVEVETGDGVRSLPRGDARDDVPGIVAELVSSGQQVYGVQPAGLHAGGRLPRGGGRRVSGALIVARYALREAVRRRVILVVLVLTVGFLALYALGAAVTFNEVDDLAAGRPARRARARRLDAARPRDVHHPLPRRRARRLPHARRGSWRRRARPAPADRRQAGGEDEPAAGSLRRSGRGVRGATWSPSTSRRC